MGIQWVPIGYQRVEKAITMHFRKWNAHACRHFVFHNALHHFMLSDSICTGAQYVNLDNKIKCLSLAFFFANPTHKTVTGTAYMWELLIANHLAQPL
jgi:hypothetical protein